MAVTVTITKTLEDWWGADDLVADYGDDTELRNTKLTELVMEDMSALLDGASMSFEVSK